MSSIEMCNYQKQLFYLFEMKINNQKNTGT
jgi:hypothetical protein